MTANSERQPRKRWYRPTVKVSGIYKVVGVRASAREIDIVNLLQDSGKRTFPLNKLPKGTKVSYSESEIALKKLLGTTWRYSEIRSSGIDRETFLSHIDELNISPYYGAVYLSGGKYIACFSDHHAENLPDDARYAWPDVENEDFRSGCWLFAQPDTSYPLFLCRLE